MRFQAATVSTSVGLALLFAVVVRDVLSDSPIHAIGGSQLFALLGLVIGLLQLHLVTTGRWLNTLTCAYVAGLVSHVVLHDVTWADGPPWDWRWAYVPIGLITLWVIGIVVSTYGVTGGSELAARIYIVGGLLVCAGHLVLLITAGAFALGFGGIAGFNIAAFWYPVALVFAMTSICFGLLPQSARPSVGISISYVVGAAILSSGTLWAANDAQVTTVTHAVMLVGLILLFPSFGVAIKKLLGKNVPSPGAVV